PLPPTTVCLTPHPRLPHPPCQHLGGTQGAHDAATVCDRPVCHGGQGPARHLARGTLPRATCATPERGQQRRCDGSATGSRTRPPAPRHAWHTPAAARAAYRGPGGGAGGRVLQGGVPAL